MITDDWKRLYGESWKGSIEDDAFVHPAKFSRALIRAIYDHALGEGWLRPGDTVLDPFGGVALGAMDAMHRGLNWVGMELEERFVLLGNRNIERWDALFRATGRPYGTAYLYHGDSRYLALLLARRANGCISSPPHAGGCAHTGGDDLHPEHIQGETYHGVGLQGVISSPPYISTEVVQSHGQSWREELNSGQGSFRNNGQGYGHQPGQLGAMPEGNLDICVSSPPFGDSAQSQDSDFTLHSTSVNPSPRRLDTRSYFPAAMDTSGNLAQMDACVSSPPFERTDTRPTALGQGAPIRSTGESADRNKGDYVYPDSPGQLGIEHAETFWAAARQVIEQIYQVLAPGAHAIWVCKDFVRDGQRVPFSHQWAQLCVSCGFDWLHEHRAWVVEDYGTQRGMFEDVTLLTERKSFFRRLAERKGAPRIDWESVLCVRKHFR